ncbi:MAG: hypothetical protein LUF30_11725 [Lachnospiraceae bacterium]|nr:hypothetical protein [Lachnospiraceae bacterium]
MDNRIVFREMLTELKLAADEQDGVLTKDRIHEILKGMPLEESHFQLIYEYLAEQNIRVVESMEDALSVERNVAHLDGDLETPPHLRRRQDAPSIERYAAQLHGAGAASEQESGDDAPERRSLSLYVEELSALSDAGSAEEIALIDRARKGDSEAKGKLIELYLPLICEMAEEYGEESLPSEDLIQEGNLGLLCAVESLAEFDSAAAALVHIVNTIRESMEKAVSHGKEMIRMDEALVGRMNHLNEAVHNLERDLGHKVSAEEVSAYLEMPMEEIEDLLRVAGDQIETDS